MTRMGIMGLVFAAACSGGSYRHEEFEESRRGRTGYINQGIEQIEAKNYDAALRLLNLATFNTPDNPAAFYHRGNVWDLKGDAHRAIADYAETIRIDPHFSSAYFKSGWVKLNRLADYQGALEDFTRAIREEPSYADAFVWRGQAFRLLGIFDAAIADLQDGLRFGPTDKPRAERWLLEASAQDVSPVLLNLFAQSTDLGTLYARFSTMVDPDTATVRSYYRLKDGGSISNAEVSPDRRVVMLRVSGPIVFGLTSLTVTPKIKGLSGHPAQESTRALESGIAVRNLESTK